MVLHGEKSIDGPQQAPMTHHNARMARLPLFTLHTFPLPICLTVPQTTHQHHLLTQLA